MSDQNDGVPPIEPTAVPPQPYAQVGSGVGYGAGAQYAPAPARAPILSILSLIAGIISIVGLWVGFIPFLGFFLGIWFPATAVVLGFFGRRKEVASRGLWLTGLILGFIGLGVALLSLIFWVIIAIVGGFHTDPTGYPFSTYSGQNS